MSFYIAVGTVPLLKFGKKPTHSKLREASLLPLTVRELKEQQYYTTTLIVPTLLVAEVQPRNGNKSTSSYPNTVIREALSPGTPNIS